MKHTDEIEQKFCSAAKKSKHTLDSDEEDNNEEEKFNDSDIEGQEPETVDYIDEIEIIPFNMKKELAEDGHIDKEGNFIFKKENEEKDVWLDSVDWKEVRNIDSSKAKLEENYDEECPPISIDEKLQLYKNILDLIGDNESVITALKRLGPKKNNQASRRWIKKKTYEPHSVDFNRLTEFADKLMQTGDFEIYQKKYRDIKDLISVTESQLNQDMDSINELEKFGSKIDADK